MIRKIDSLHYLVQELSDRYGADDADVRQLQAEWGARQEREVPVQPERRKAQVCRYTFGSVARQHYRGQSTPRA